MLTTRSFRRNVKNKLLNCTEAQVKVREATSNDPWGPCTALMSEIAGLTYSVVTFLEVMPIIWKRLTDDGKNWRHVYKGLVLLEYLVKNGSEKVLHQSRDKIYLIQALRNFRYTESYRDYGANIREKARQLVALLTDEDRLRRERTHAFRVRKRLNDVPSEYHYKDYVSRYLDLRPKTKKEEDLQVKLSVEISKEEARRSEQRHVKDTCRLRQVTAQIRQHAHSREAGEGCSQKVPGHWDTSFIDDTTPHFAETSGRFQESAEPNPWFSKGRVDEFEELARRHEHQPTDLISFPPEGAESARRAPPNPCRDLVVFQPLANVGDASYKNFCANSKNPFTSQMGEDSWTACPIIPQYPPSLNPFLS